MKEVRHSLITAAEKTGNLTLSGIPVVFEKLARISSEDGTFFNEIIKRGALDQTDMSDVRLLYAHDVKRLPLARTPRTLQLLKNEQGLEMLAELPQTEEARAIYTAVYRGDLTGMSFAFTVAPGGESYDANTRTRTITAIKKIYEISVVVYPAYETASVEARAQFARAEAIRQSKIKINQILRKVI